MNQYKCFVIILYVISILDIRINGQTSVTSSNVYRLQRKREPLKILSGKRRFPATRNDGDIIELIFGVLLPEGPTQTGCTYHAALPAIELAIKKLQEPNGLLEQYNICVEYRDTKTTSVHGSLAAFDLYVKQPPDAIFGPIESYSLAQISRFANVWELPVISPGGLSEAFTLKTSHVSIGDPFHLTWFRCECDIWWKINSFVRFFLSLDMTK